MEVRWWGNAGREKKVKFGSGGMVKRGRDLIGGIRIFERRRMEGVEGGRFWERRMEVERAEIK